MIGRKEAPERNYPDNEHMFANKREGFPLMEERVCVKNEDENMFALSRESEACFLICPPGSRIK